MMIDGVVVPVLHAAAQRAVELGGDNIDPRFDESAGQEALLTPLMPPITVANRVGFSGEVKGRARLRAEQHVDCLRLEPVRGFKQSGLVDRARQLVQRSPQRDSSLQ